MVKFLLLMIGTVLLFTPIVHCQALNATDSAENITEIIPPKSYEPFIYYGRYHQRRFRREYPYQGSASDNAVATILSILPIDRIGAIIGQIMATGLKEMLNPNVGKKVVNVIENQAPSLLTSLFTNLYTNLRGPVRPLSTNTTMSMNKNVNNRLSNSSTSTFINSIRRPGKK